MTGIEEECVPGRLETGVESDRQFDRPEVGSDMASRLRDMVEQETPDLRRQIFELGQSASTQRRWIREPCQFDRARLVDRELCTQIGFPSARVGSGP